MTDKELRRLKRAELLEILFYLQKENEELKEEIQRLKFQPSTGMGGTALPEDFMEQLRQMIQEAVHAPENKSASEFMKRSGNIS